MIRGQESKITARRRNADREYRTKIPYHTSELPPFPERLAKIYAFEPLKPTYEFLLKNMVLNPKYASKIECFNLGLGEKDEILSVNFNLDHAMSVSSNAVFDSCFAVDSVEQIEIRNASEIINEILQKHTQEKIFLKIDCELLLQRKQNEKKIVSIH